MLQWIFKKVVIRNFYLEWPYIVILDVKKDDK